MRRELDIVLEELDAAERSGAKPLPRAMKIAQYADYRGVSIRTVYRWITLGLSGVERRGKTTRIVVVEADRWDEREAIRRNAEINASGGQ